MLKREANSSMKSTQIMGMPSVRRKKLRRRLQPYHLFFVEILAATPSSTA